MTTSPAPDQIRALVDTVTTPSFAAIVDRAHAAERARRPPRRPRRVPPRALVALAGAFLLLVGIVVAVSLLSGNGGTHSRPLGTKPTPAPAPTTPVVEKRCGESLPYVPNLSEEFTGPLTGPAPDNPTPQTAPEQLVLHWSSPTANVEFRWPADDEGPAQGPQVALPPGEVPSLSIASVAMQGPDDRGRFVQSAYLRFTDQPVGCQVMSRTVSSTDQAAAAEVAARFDGKPFAETGQLVVGEQAVESEPPVTPCRTPPGVSSPNVGGPTDPASPRYDAPADALRTFIDEHPGLLPVGYIAMHLTDGSITYGVRAPFDDVFVTLVHVQPDGGRWWVDRWEGSGC